MLSLFDPNVAYVTAMLALLVVVLAVLTPGTGILELGAFFLLTVAGYQVSQMAVNLWALVFVALGLLPLALAFRRKNTRLALGTSLALFFIGSALLFQDPEGGLIGVHPLVILTATLLEGGFLWLLAEKSLETLSSPPMQDLSRLIGEVGEARTPVYREGSVYVNGEAWSARSEVPIQEGEHVKVVGREGFFLLVEPLRDGSSQKA